MDFYSDNPVFLRNLQLYPLLTDRPIECRLQAIDKLLEEKKIQISELDDPAVNKIDLDNLSGHPVLMIDGEEIAGAMQNRIVTASTFIAARTRKTLSVACVEEGRWQPIGGFTTGYCSYPRLRSVLSKKRSGEDLQQNVWDEITRKIELTRTNSKTSSMHDIYQGLEDELNRYLEDFNTLGKNAIGFIGVADNRILGCDVFANNNVFRQFERKLIRGYALEAYELTNKGTKAPDIDKFIKNIRTKALTTDPGRRTWLRFDANGINGQAAFSKKALLHLSAFPQ